MRKLICAVLCLMVIASAAQSGAIGGLEIKAPSGILMHMSGKVLYEKDADRKMEPASVTKVMTLLLAVEAIEAGQVSLDDTVTGSEHAASMGGSQIWMEVGEQFTVHELIKCIAVASANDCSAALAEHISGTEEAFAVKMNERAAELGMTNTHFVNSSGLPADGHVTTARDIAKMSCELMRHDMILDYTLIKHDTIRDGASVLDNTNKLVGTYNGITGLKTGSTNTAGFCLSATAQRDGLYLIAVVMKGNTGAERNADAAAMLNYGFANYAKVSLTPDAPIMPVPVDLGMQSHVKCDLAVSEPGIYEKAKLKTLEKQITMLEQLKAPVEMGQVVGQLTIRAGDEIIASVPIITQHVVERMSLLDIFTAMLRIAVMRA